MGTQTVWRTGDLDRRLLLSASRGDQLNYPQQPEPLKS
jgi:hypothetical protein